MKSIVILQSNYIPWKGYFDLMHDCNEFILFDDMQYTKRDWRNRNRVKTPNGIEWLTIPVEVKGKFFQRIDQTFIADPRWASNHWEKIISLYRKAPYFPQYVDEIEALYEDAANKERLSTINRLFLEGINRLLGIKTIITCSSDYPSFEGKSERLVGLCNSSGATHYISGPAAKDYIDPSIFADAGVKLIWKDYSGYPEYPQQYPPFEHGVSILDLLFNVGPDSPWYIWGWRKSLNLR